MYIHNMQYMVTSFIFNGAVQTKWKVARGFFQSFSIFTKRVIIDKYIKIVLLYFRFFFSRFQKKKKSNFKTFSKLSFLLSNNSLCIYGIQKMSHTIILTQNGKNNHIFSIKYLLHKNNKNLKKSYILYILI